MAAFGIVVENSTCVLMVLDGVEWSGHFLTVLVCPGPICSLFSPVLLSCSLMVFARSSSVWPVQGSCGCFWIVVAGCIWFLKVLYGGGGLWRVPDCSGGSDPNYHFSSPVLS